MRVMTCAVACVALAVGVCCAADKDNKKPSALELIRPANALIKEAQGLYMEGEPKQAVEAYRKAYEKLLEVEQEHYEAADSPDFALLRFGKLTCEREIERILLEDAQTYARTMTVSDTAELEKKRAERKKAATEADAAVAAPLKLGSKGGTAAAEAQADAAADNAPVQAGDELEWAKDMIQFGRFEDAEQSLVKVLRIDRENREARFLMALSRVKQGRCQDALVVLDDLLADDAADEPALLLAAGAYMATSSYSKAVDALARAMAANPKRPDALINMAWLLLEMRPDTPAEAEQYYRLAVKMGAGRVRELEKRLGIKAE